MRQVLVNLVGNAVKFTDEGEVILKIRMESQSPEGVGLYFEIRDSGPGISERVQKRLFKPFSQADSSSTRKQGGTGLGLVISKRLIQLMGGEVGLESEPGKGATFWFRIFFDRATSSESVPLKPDGSLEGLKMLVVDDNATNRSLLHYILKSWGIKSDSVPTARDAIEVVRMETVNGHPFDCLLIDMQMPEMDGLELARTLRNDPATADTRMVMLSSTLVPPDTRLLTEAGIFACLQKPVKKSLLFDCLLSVIEGQPLKLRKPVRVEARPSLPEGEVPAVRSARLLIAEDNQINQMLIYQVLKKHGFKADMVANGIEVLRALEQIHYDLILMDCQMPEMDGYEAAAKIREREQERAESSGLQSRIFIVAVTANAMKGDRERCLKSGMDDYLSKPIDEAGLLEVLDRWLGDDDNAHPRDNPPPEELARSKEPEGVAEPVSVRATVPPPLVDIRRLERATFGDAEKMREIIQLYLSQSVEMSARIRAAIDSGAFEDLEFAAHKFAGISSNCGVVSVVKSLHELENLGREGRLSGAAELLETVIERMKDVRQFFEDYSQAR